MTNHIDHSETFRFLKEQGYPLLVIRRIMPKLVGIEHEEIAQALGTRRNVITSTISGARRPKNLQQSIAEILGCPKEELFRDGAA